MYKHTRIKHVTRTKDKYSLNKTATYRVYFEYTKMWFCAGEYIFFNIAILTYVQTVNDI